MVIPHRIDMVAGVVGGRGIQKLGLKCKNLNSNVCLQSFRPIEPNLAHQSSNFGLIWV